MKIWTEADHHNNALAETTIAVIGYGSQGRAHANNLAESGFKVIIGARRDGVSWKRAGDDGFEVAEPAEAAARAGLIAMLAPDMAQPEIYQQVQARIRPGSALLFAHGFNIHFGCIRPRADIDVIMVAPKGPGDLVRRQYQEGRGVPCLRAVEQDASGQAHARALSYAHGIGGTRGGVIDTSFQEETETDLFGEQVVLCGGTAELVIQGFETLVEAGYQPEVAYFECLHELKLIVDLLHEGGMAKMYEFVSDTAAFGDLTRGPRIIDESTRERMREVLGEIRTGEFARDWILENQAGLPRHRALIKARTGHEIEQVGKALRARMSWLQAGADKSREQAA
ncbi:ketol-acid reductoisomerase [Wenzhouxiangella sp. AB-CW3]|uniref:ketol-acid reductoisomerase n=1 Tax=Wenzhouxiangella sp. AB-CW3 TaxID=2771012 RepID=UPI00168B0DD1|nr:ketol-acid reductoisomerase [Wenzhouxiangella sp. AB-CW3]QOC22071.1 ketol-acid reductoisomerase [Wenzhouxiangella sp. AB-CW3]